MKINVTDRDKVKVVSYNSYGLFRMREKFSSSSATPIELFDRKWRSGLLALLTNAISNERLLTPNLVKDRLQEVSWHKAVQYVDTHQVHYEFKYEGFLCIAQLKNLILRGQSLIDLYVREIK